MKEKLLNNLGLKVASLVLAFGVWMAIVNISNPVIGDSQLVPVEVRNEEALKAADLTYEIDGKDMVAVYYQVRTRDRSLIKASDFKAYVDLKDYNVTGAVPVTVEINKDKEGLVKSDTITAKPMVIRIITEQLQTKRFDLQVVTKGKAKEGYQPGTINLVPDHVTVEGPESLVGQINHMGVEIQIAANTTSDINATAEPLFYDANGNKLNLSDKVTVNKSQIDYYVQILKAKNLPLNFEVTGQVAKGYRYTGLESDVKSVAVAGTKSVLASLTSIDVSSDKLNIDGATKDKIVRLDLSQYLPPNTTIAGDEYKDVSVKLKVEPLTTRVFTLQLSNLDKKGMSEDYNYSFDKQTCDVTVKGLKEDLDALKEENLNAVLDVSDLNPGTYPGMIHFEVAEGFEVTVYTPFNVTVAKENTVSTETQSTTVSETTESSAQ
ncbi:CdaR family protein [Clostridium boliviensis]|uniref:CdaR family protein n=1 Tax=Clostridium boliviensis TaxID=318465 RepID=A0ABU4GIY8_9CLOT|nr:CdaR family protein [Clostridium boliviensis]MDW2796227.1 CdaR family protein [Clostridium boliviensis]